MQPERTQSMKALVKNDSTAGFKLVDDEKPTLGLHEVLVVAFKNGVFGDGLGSLKVLNWCPGPDYRPQYLRGL